MFERIVSAIRLDSTLYREVADHDYYNTEAILIAVVVAFVGGLGAALGSGNALSALVGEMVNALLFGWLLWAVVAYLVGDLFGGRSSLTEMARTLAYAGTPRLLLLLGFIPIIGWLFVVAGWGLSIAAGVVAIRESMEFDTFKALITAGVGLILYILVSFAINAFL